MTSSEQNGTRAINQAIRESFGRAVYTHKTHEKAREISSFHVTVVKWLNIVLTTATSGSLLSTIITNERALLYTSAAFAAATLAFGIFQLSFDPGADVERHREAAKNLWYIREKYIHLLTDMTDGLGRDEMVERRDALMEEAGAIYRQAPDTSNRAYQKARRALKYAEDMTFNDAEIDAFLPKALRVSK